MSEKWAGEAQTGVRCSLAMCAHGTYRAGLQTLRAERAGRTGGGVVKTMAATKTTVILTWVPHGAH